MRARRESDEQNARIVIAETRNGRTVIRLIAIRFFTDAGDFGCVCAQFGTTRATGEFVCDQVDGVDGDVRER